MSVVPFNSLPLLARRGHKSSQSIHIWNDHVRNFTNFVWKLFL